MTRTVAGRITTTLRWLTRLALGLGVLGAAAALLAGPAYRWQWLALPSAFMVLRWATYGALAGSAIAALVLLVALLHRVGSGLGLAAVALLLGLVVAALPVYQYQQAQRLPKIHDISTDTADPPLFVEVLPLRQGARNPVEYRPETAEQQKRGYPDIAPLRLALPAAKAFERAERVARELGWQVVAVKPEAGRIEATDTTLLFGFRDDIVIRVRALDAGSVVDLRSLSRIGGSDIGANARRVRAFAKRLAEG